MDNGSLLQTLLSVPNGKSDPDKGLDRPSFTRLMCEVFDITAGASAQVAAKERATSYRFHTDRQTAGCRFESKKRSVFSGILRQPSWPNTI
jgi:hypothetical protein